MALLQVGSPPLPVELEIGQSNISRSTRSGSVSTVTRPSHRTNQQQFWDVEKNTDVDWPPWADSTSSPVPVPGSDGRATAGHAEETG